jgi:hypothetical protein
MVLVYIYSVVVIIGVFSILPEQIHRTKARAGDRKAQRTGRQLAREEIATAQATPIPTAIALSKLQFQFNRYQAIQIKSSFTICMK